MLWSTAIAIIGYFGRAAISVALYALIGHLTDSISIRPRTLKRVCQKIQIPRVQPQPILAPHPALEAFYYSHTVLKICARVAIKEKSVSPIHPIY